jgi:IMP dehydrogenase
VVPARGGPRPSLEGILLGPAEDGEGTSNLFGSARRAMAKCGYSSVKEFQRAELTLVTPRA